MLYASLQSEITLRVEVEDYDKTSSNDDLDTLEADLVLVKDEATPYILTNRPSSR